MHMHLTLSPAHLDLGSLSLLFILIQKYAAEQKSIGLNGPGVGWLVGQQDLNKNYFTVFHETEG